jgi:hypothetical protein
MSVSYVIGRNKLKILPYIVKLGYKFTLTDIRAAIENTNINALEIIMNTNPDKTLLITSIHHAIIHTRYHSLSFILKHKNCVVDWKRCLDLAFNSGSERAVLEILYACPSEIVDDTYLLRATGLYMGAAADNIYSTLLSSH